MDYFKVGIFFEGENEIKYYGFPLPDGSDLPEEYFQGRIKDYNKRRDNTKIFSVHTIEKLKDREEFKKTFNTSDDEMHFMGDFY